jgi:hypothetical protein
MKTNLEDFIDDNREAFDSYKPGNKVWEAIEKELPHNKQKKSSILQMKWLIRTSVAAAIILTTASIFYFSQFIKSGNTVSPQVAESGVPAEYAEEVYHFTKLIELKHKQLKKIEKEQPELYRQFAGDISLLDSNYQVLRKELPGHPNQELLIQTMISNLKWQINLLNEQLNIIQKIKHAKRTQHEKEATSI